MLLTANTLPGGLTPQKWPVLKWPALAGFKWPLTVELQEVAIVVAYQLGQAGAASRFLPLEHDVAARGR